MSEYEKMADEMAFRPMSQYDVRYLDARDALITLTQYVNCAARPYEAYDALKIIQTYFGIEPVIREFKRCMEMEDEDMRMMACAKWLDLIEKNVRRKAKGKL